MGDIMARNKKKKNNPIIVGLLSILVVGLIICNVIFYKGYIMYRNAINETSIDDKIKTIQDNDSYIKLSDVSSYYKDAVIAVEDHRFYEHKGIDLISTTSAIFSNIKTQSLGMGGSTITQQLAKNMYFSQKKEFTRKVAELFVAFDLEKKLTKDEILELYVNIIYFGDGYYGIKDASNGYYNKEAIELTKEEAIMLAGLPAAPSVYSPNVNKDLANQRYKQVESAMFKYGYLKNEN